jgi:hypothetical protein
MGHQMARDIALSNLSLETKLAWHLQSNHYPPIHESFIPTALVAIGLANTNNWDLRLNYPNGLVRTVTETIKGMHLEAFLDGNDDY